jgi:hypothetical protein
VRTCGEPLSDKLSGEQRRVFCWTPVGSGRGNDDPLALQLLSGDERSRHGPVHMLVRFDKLTQIVVGTPRITVCDTNRFRGAINAERAEAVQVATESRATEKIRNSTVGLRSLAWMRRPATPSNRSSRLRGDRRW